MKRIFLTTVLILLAYSLFGDSDIGLSFSTFTSLSDDSLLEEGSHVKLGVTAALSQRTEAEISMIYRMIPNPALSAVLSAQISYALASPMFMSDEVPMYLNMFVGVGGLVQLPTFGSWGPTVSFTPLTTGGPEFFRKERLSTISWFWDIPHARLGIFLQLFGIDFYL